jgi:hypothetical protein
MGEDGVSPEQTLLVACCDWPRSAQAIRAAAARDVDWDRFLRLAERRRVWGLVGAALSETHAAPPAVTEQTAARAAAVACRNMLLAAETIRLQRRFDAVGIAVLFSKGAVLAQLAWHSLTVKESKDIDLLVSPAKAEAACRFLEAEGYRLQSPAKTLDTDQFRAMLRYGNGLSLVHPATGTEVDLHWQLSENPMRSRGIDFFAETQSVSIANGAEIRTMGAETLFIYLCLHGGGHTWCRIKWLADLNAWLAGMESKRVSVFYETATRCGAGICAALGLRLCGRIFALRIPADVAEKIRQSRRLDLLETLCLRALFGAENETLANVIDVKSSRLARLMQGLGLRFFLKQYRFEVLNVSRTLAWVGRGRPAFPYVLYSLVLRPPLHVVRHVCGFIVKPWRQRASVKSPVNTGGRTED